MAYLFLSLSSLLLLRCLKRLFYLVASLQFRKSNFLNPLPLHLSGSLARIRWTQLLSGRQPTKLRPNERNRHSFAFLFVELVYIGGGEKQSDGQETPKNEKRKEKRKASGKGIRQRGTRCLRGAQLLGGFGAAGFEERGGLCKTPKPGPLEYALRHPLVDK